MKVNRRNFLRQTGLIAATPLIANELWSCTPSSKTEEKILDSTATFSIISEPSVKEFGLQLWTVKEDMAKDPKGVLKSLASYGYKQIESFEGDKGIFWGMTAKDFKTYMDELGMTIVSTHCNPDFTMKIETEDKFKKLADDAASIGMKYLINPFLGSLKTADEWKKAAEGLNRQGEIASKVGLKAGYHNHHFEFKKFADGTCPEQILLEGTDPKLVDFELDLYWVVKAGENPEEWLTKYKDRFRLCHVKDYYKEEKMKEIEAKEKQTDPFWPIGGSTIVGTGRIDFAKILNTAKANGMEYYIVEQERFDGTTPLKAVETDATYMKNLVFA
ncbi:MAG: sugar phosphate isomerase/epimerase [Emticicia sp.]|nr:sugar phosphate isomerase/epimerase [Emticicia sp.]